MSNGHSRKLFKPRLLGSADAIEVRIFEVQVQKYVCLTCVRGNSFAEAGLRNFLIRGFPPVQTVPPVQLFMAENKLVTGSVQV